MNTCKQYPSSQRTTDYLDMNNDTKMRMKLSIKTERKTHLSKNQVSA